jgi:hypothetical protein
MELLHSHAMPRKTRWCPSGTSARIVPIKKNCIVYEIFPIARDLQTAKLIFDAFHGASGLACNVQKSQINKVKLEQLKLSKTDPSKW